MVRYLADKVKAIEARGPELDTLMTTGSAATSAITAMRERLGLPLDQAQTQFLDKQRTLRSEIGELSSAIRNERFGAALTATELASANEFLPTQDDSPGVLRSKLKGMKKLARSVINRQNEVLEKGIRVTPADEEPEETVATATVAPPAATTGRVPPPLELNQSPREYARKLVKDYGLTEEEAAARARAEIARLQGEGG